MSSYSVISFYSQDLPEGYRALIYSKWLRSLRYGNDFYKMIDKEAYFQAQHQYIAIIMNKPRTVVRLAVLTDDHDIVLGFSVYRGNVLDYVHVHKDVRRLGIASTLVPESFDTVTHWTNVGLLILGTKCKKWIFNPFA